MAAHPTTKDSEFISAVRITMIFGLVVHHLFMIPNSDYFPRQSLNFDLLSVANVLNGLFHWSTMAAVPLLSIISGYLYFARKQVKHRSLLAKRANSVMLPSLAWTALWFVSGYAIATAGQPFGMFQWLAYDAGQFTWLTPLNGIIGITKHPLAFQFWFIHDLVLTLLLAPAIGGILQRAAMPFIGVLMAVWLLDAVPFPFFSGNVLVFFCCGAFLAVRSISLTEATDAGRPWSRAIYGLFLLLLLTRMMSDLHPIFGSYLWLCLLRIAGVASVAMLIASQLQRRNYWLHRLGKYSPYAFFIFASHYPLIEFFKITVERVPLQDTPIGQLLTLFAVPSATIIVCIMSAKVLARCAPRLFAFANGGRDLASRTETAEPYSEHGSSSTVQANASAVKEGDSPSTRPK